MENKLRRRKDPMSGLIQKMTYLLVSLIELMLSLRFVARLFGASSQAPFIAWLYENTAPLLAPFLYVFPSPSVKGRFVLEFSTLFAIFVYSFGAYLILEVMSMLGSFENKKK
ncbi:MAG: hypothetical protein CO156_05330 [Candidatus Pacebacteria bacterium CG_4_9_14_3_um_filter_40_12]|nr:MAG: hypothetical protein COU64_03615 [Candidatus Pacebacteria bacterium CG10_big_fil_rev_8_21_14_0_10_40_26]PIZ78760.1 MAG: hypothetical protein COY01_03985 [Candidatus Pacebacteria bacterium CG_4_10_14_0_2_um_filter_40_20]PJA68389.1 MAG: hypothetical protein CO156_05330 [Candidatus Pacebacteria bacterium CG_4_9_14_3_um_filter_40_12]PJC41251.1 MAG: hypothetical protein CO041_05400 [Candidatus Pacebacteria bacterium CG_4_9_14_0_2_um_filter_40_15]